MSEQYQMNNRYQLNGLIAKGRLGDVYRAGDIFFRRDVALKMLRRETATPDFLQYFEGRYAQTVAALAKLSNPAIIKTYDFTRLNNVPVWTMDLLSGTGLHQYAGSALSVEQAAGLLIPAADALAYAHQYGVIHGNLKPSNILFSDAQTPVLTDFGLAQWLSENGHGYGAYEVSAGIGSPEYLAPEQAQGQAADARTDVYSLGIIFYELITGHRPFSAVSPLETMAHQVSDQLPSPRYYVPGISQQAEQFLYQATAKNPAARISSMGEFAQMLRMLSTASMNGAYYPPASYYAAPVPSEDDDDDDDDENFIGNAAAAVKNFLATKNGKIILIAAAALVVAGVILGIVSSNNQKIAAMNATATQEMLSMQQTQEAIQQEAEAQQQATIEALEQEKAALAAAAAQATQDAQQQPTAAPALPELPVMEATLIPTASSAGSGRFQYQYPSDGTSYIMGEAFTVTWTMENTGSEKWSTYYKLVYVGGTNFATGGVTEKYLVEEVWPGGASGIALPCTAPQAIGTYEMRWQLEDANGNTVFSPLSISINVVDGELTDTPVPTDEEEEETATPTPEYDDEEDESEE